MRKNLRNNEPKYTMAISTQHQARNKKIMDFFSLIVFHSQLLWSYRCWKFNDEQARYLKKIVFFPQSHLLVAFVENRNVTPLNCTFLTSWASAVVGDGAETYWVIVHLAKAHSMLFMKLSLAAQVLKHLLLWITGCLLSWLDWYRVQCDI